MKISTGTQLLEHLDANDSFTKIPVLYTDNEAAYRTFMGQWMLYNVTRDLPIKNFVTDRYKTMQNNEVFKIIDELVDITGSPLNLDKSMVSADRGFILTSFTLDDAKYTVAGDDDKVYSNLVVINSFDGSSGIKIIFTNKRVLCKNQLPALRKDSKTRIESIKHTDSAGAKLQYLRKSLVKFKEYMEISEELFKKMNEEFIDSDTYIPEFGDKMFNFESTRGKNSYLDFLGAYTNGAGQSMLADTKYKVYNGYTYYLDHLVSKNENFVKNQFIGSINNKKLEALSVIN